MDVVLFHKETGESESEHRTVQEGNESIDIERNLLLLSIETPDPYRVGDFKYLSFKLSQQCFDHHASIYNFILSNASLVTYLFCGLLLVCCGTLILGLGRSSVSKTVYYDVTRKSVNVQLSQQEGWNESAEWLLYFYVEGFKETFKKYAHSRPREIFPGFSCHEFDSLEYALKVRPEESIPELSVNRSSSEEKLFPCGLSSFALFNDQIDVNQFNTSHAIAHHLAPDPFQLSHFATHRVPGNVRPGSFWIQPSDPQYMNWVAMGVGSPKLIFLGTVPGLKLGNVTFNIIKNHWPAHLWNARKGIRISQLSAIGSSQDTLGWVYIGSGCIVSCIFPVLLCLRKRVIKYDLAIDSSSSCPPPGEYPACPRATDNVVLLRPKLRISSAGVAERLKHFSLQRENTKLALESLLRIRSKSLPTVSEIALPNAPPLSVERVATLRKAPTA